MGFDRLYIYESFGHGLSKLFISSKDLVMNFHLYFFQQHDAGLKLDCDMVTTLIYILVNRFSLVSLFK